MASQLLDFIEVAFTGVLVVTLVHAASMFQHMLSVWMTQQIASVSEPEKQAKKRGPRRKAPKVPVTGVLALVAQREALRTLRAQATNVGGR